MSDNQATIIDDFLETVGGFIDNDDNNNNNNDDDDDNDETNHDFTKVDQQIYNPRKPKWWKQLSGKASKAQKRAMNEMLPLYQLPRVPHGTFLDWDKIFPLCTHKNKEIWFEIGFGRGENLLALAHIKQKQQQQQAAENGNCDENEKNSNNFCLVGAEIHNPGIGVVCQRIQQGRIEKKYWTDYDIFQNGNSNLISLKDDCEENDPYNNVRIHVGDGVKLLPYIPDSSIAAVLVTFPDPFPREHQKQWRLMQTHTIKQFLRILKPLGYLYLATDHEGYFVWSHQVMQEFNDYNEVGPDVSLFELVTPCPDRCDWLPVISRYEQKGWDEGRKTNLSCWRKRLQTKE